MTTRPPSTLAQKITAVAAVVIAVTLISSITVTVKVLDLVGRGIDSALSSAVDVPLAFPQAVCLAYSKTVIDLHTQGLSPEQIEGVLDHAKKSALQDRKPAGDEDWNVPIESREMCGPPADVLAAGGMGSG